VIYRLKHAARTRIWLIPLLGLLGGLGLAVVTIAVDRAHHFSLVSQAVTGTPTDVQTILSTAATALVTLTSVVLSLTLVAVQLAMGQFSPRIVGALLNDRLSQAAIALFTGTFSYTVLVTREVNDKTGAIPGVSVLTSYALILGSVLALVLFVHHAGQGIRASGLIDLVGDRTRDQLETAYPRRHADAPPLPDGREVLASPAPGPRPPAWPARRRCRPAVPRRPGPPRRPDSGHRGHRLRPRRRHGRRPARQPARAVAQRVRARRGRV
jgi:uncharacterized membrane protein